MFLAGEDLLRLYHPELSKVLGGLRLLSAERRLEDPDLLQGGEGRLFVELGALAEAGLLAEVIDRE
jgi:hypothetical protein